MPKSSLVEYKSRPMNFVHKINELTSFLNVKLVCDVLMCVKQCNVIQTILPHCSS